MTDQAIDLLGEAGFDPVYGSQTHETRDSATAGKSAGARDTVGHFIAGDTIKVT